MANADNLKVPQFPKAQVYHLPTQVPGFPSQTSIFPPKSLPLLQSRTPSHLPPSISVKEKLNSPSSSSSSSSSNQPSSFHQHTVKVKPNFSSSSPSLLARSSTASTKCYRVNRQHTNACTDTRQRRGHWKPPGNTDRQWQHCPRASYPSSSNKQPTKRRQPSLYKTFTPRVNKSTRLHQHTYTIHAHPPYHYKQWEYPLIRIYID